MNDILRLLKAFETWIYVILGLAGLAYLRKFTLALRDWRATEFGMERSIAQRRLNEAATGLVLAVLIALAEIFVTSFVVPRVPNLQVLSTPTLAVLTTPTSTLPAGLPGLVETTPLFPTATVVTAGGQPAGGCIANKLEFTDPKNGQNVSGIVNLKGILAVENFGFYKYEYSRVGSNVWITIAAGNQINPDQSLGFWDTSQLTPGDYLLQLVVTDNKGMQLPACVTSVKVVSPTRTP
jgi:hypothetical protein